MSLADIIPEVKINPGSFMLVYFPFEEGRHEFIQPDVQVAINKNTVALSKSL